VPFGFISAAPIAPGVFTANANGDESGGSGGGMGTGSGSRGTGSGAGKAGEDGVSARISSRAGIAAAAQHMATAAQIDIGAAVRMEITHPERYARWSDGIMATPWRGDIGRSRGAGTC
jgi:hypothetical protein